MDTERAALDALAARLWDERRLVMLLLYRLTVSKLLLAADERRFAPDALREVDEAVELLRDEEFERDLAVRELAGIWQLAPEELTLPVVAQRAPEPYRHTFAEHLNAFQTLAAEIDAVTAENRTLAVMELEQVSDTIEQITGTPTRATTTYDRRGQLDQAGRVGGRLRETL